MPEPFCGQIPDDRRYDVRYDMWATSPDDRGIIRVGVTSFGIHLAGEIIMFVGKPQGADVSRGRGLGTVETGKTILAVHSPVSLTGILTNQSVEDNPRAINEDPYGAGWLAEGAATDWKTDVSFLVDANAYRSHVMSIDPDARFAEESW